ncbi:MAG: extracellular matrix/biofilm biosynthesis regulator RemA family protein [Bacillota bacterium]
MGPGTIVNVSEVVMVLDWASGKDSSENREMVSYARAHGFLVEAKDPPQSLVVTEHSLYLTPVSAATLRKRFDSNIVSPPSDGMLR